MDKTSMSKEIKQIDPMGQDAKYSYPASETVMAQMWGLFPAPRTDCKFYSEQRDMCAVIPCCSLHEGLGNCPCDDCKQYRSKYAFAKTAQDMFREQGYVLKEKVENERYVYEKPAGEGCRSVILRVIITTEDVCFLAGDMFTCATAGEIRAAYQQLNEMRVKQDDT